MRILHQRALAPESLGPWQRRKYEVTENASKRCRSGQLLTGSVGRSALVAAHNDRTMQGFMGRFTGASVGRDDSNPSETITAGGVQFDRALRRIAGLGPSHQTYVWLGGISLYDEMGEQAVGATAERRYVRRHIAALAPLASLTAEWISEPNEDMRVQLNPEVGRLYIERIHVPRHVLEAASGELEQA